MVQDKIQLMKEDGTREAIGVPTIYCVGLNYAGHAAEMKSERPAEPVIFIKPASALVTDGLVTYPAITEDLHHEVEVVIVLGEDARHLSPETALDKVLGYGVGLDLTLRDRQSRAKAKGQPWAISKGFAQSAPVSDFVPAARVSDPQNLDFGLAVNGETRQQGNSREMLFGIAELLVYLSSVFQLRRGDLVFTGTPAGVSPLRRGDRLEAGLADLVRLDCRID